MTLLTRVLLSALLFLEAILLQASASPDVRGVHKRLEQTQTRRNLKLDPEISVERADFDSIIAKKTSLLFKSNSAIRVNQVKQPVAAPGKTPPAGKVSPPAGKVSPPAGKVSPPAGKVSPPAGKVSPPVGKVSPPAGKVSPPAGKVSPPAGKVSPPAGKSSPPASKTPPPAPAGSNGQVRLKKMLDALSQQFWMTPKRELDTFWKAVTDQGYNSLIISILDKNNAITILWPNNQAMKYSKPCAKAYQNQRLGFHLVVGQVGINNLNRANKGDWWKTMVHYPSVMFSGLTPVVYKLTKPVRNETLQLGSRPSAVAGAKIVTPEVYKSTDIIVHVIDMFMEPYRYWNNLP